MLLKEVIWLGTSKEDVSRFPAPVKEDLGFELYRLQQGRPPLSSRPMKSIGQGVYELKQADRSGWYRVIYTLEFKGKIYVLHCFEKKSAKTPKDDLALAKKRLKQI